MYGNIIELFRATVPCVSGHHVLGQATAQAGYQLIKGFVPSESIMPRKATGLQSFHLKTKIRKNNKNNTLRRNHYHYCHHDKLVCSTRKIRVPFCVGSRTHLRFIGIYCGHYCYCTRVDGFTAPSCRLAMTWIARTDIL